MKKLATTLCLAVVSYAVAYSQGTILWNESVNGPFSESSSTPTILGQLQFGTNSIIGTTEVEPTGPSWSAHPDFFAFSVPSNLAVSAVYLQVNKQNVWAWVGDPAFLNELGFVVNPSSGELLSQWSLNAVGQGTYGMYMSNHDLQPVTSVANYRLDFWVVPEPSALQLSLMGAGGLVGLRFWGRLRLETK